MKVYKMTVLVLDFENRNQESLEYELENNKYVPATVMETQVADIGEWHDEHPLNFTNTQKEEFKRLFP